MASLLKEIWALRNDEEYLMFVGVNSILLTDLFKVAHLIFG